MAGMLGLEPAQVGQLITATEMMKSGPVERLLKGAQARKALTAEPDLSFEQRMELKKAGPGKTPEELDYLRAGTKLRNAQAMAEKGRDYKTSQMYSDANAYYDDLYRKLQDEFGTWKDMMWSLKKNEPATSGMWEGMTYAQGARQIAKMIDEDNKLIWQGKPPKYATGAKTDVRGKHEADSSIGGDINRWKQGR